MRNRGPDQSNILFSDGLFYHGAVLWQQGEGVCGQPVESKDVVLLFNGDLYMKTLQGQQKSDTEFLFEMISKSKSEAELLNVFETLVGPFSIICFFQSSLYFARDLLGRNSLILGKHQENVFLCSVLDPAGMAFKAMEIPPLGVYKLNVSTKEVDLFPYRSIDSHPHFQMQLEELGKILTVNLRQKLNLKQSIKAKQPPKFSFDDVSFDSNSSNLFNALLEIPEINETCETFIELLSESVKERIQRTPGLCKNCVETRNSSCNHCRVGILFSGGVDCSILAAISDKLIDSNLQIDLMNVAFEKITYTKIKTEDVNWNVPDRLTGLQTLDELRKLCRDRDWNFIEINIKRAELNENLSILSSLVFPLSNVLDESLGAALYFASRGKGLVDGVPYTSPCRVILMGSGADELFGGYSRHRNAFKRSTVDCDLLLEELNLDWARLPSRNLARDDRVIADHGITVRAPFIEENFVNFVQQLKPLQRCFPALPEGVGDKLLLRLSAFKLGLHSCSQFRKRALQFGSRIADKRQSAKDTSTLLTSSLK